MNYDLETEAYIVGVRGKLKTTGKFRSTVDWDSPIKTDPIYCYVQEGGDSRKYNEVVRKSGLDMSQGYLLAQPPRDSDIVESDRIEVYMHNEQMILCEIAGKAPRVAANHMTLFLRAIA